MTRDDIKDEVIKTTARNILCEFPTGLGKSKLAIDFIKSRYKKGDKILIVIPKLVLIDNWKDEFKKWKASKLLNSVTFTTYVSFPKHVGSWRFCIYDEGHHLTDRCFEAISMPEFKADYNIILSATVGYKKRWDLKVYFRKLETFKIGMRKAIENEILPDPKVYLIPLTLDSTHSNVQVTDINRKTGKTTVYYCTQQQYYNKMCNLINYFKLKSHSKTFMDLYLHECGKRLKWLSDIKENAVNRILEILDKERTLTFCNSIEQTEVLGKHCINSKNSSSDSTLKAFNAGRINHITACAMLDEGVNLTDCKVGVFCMINSSERMQFQRLGRILRHKEPVIVIPYYVNTREEEIVLKMTQNYNPQLVTTIKNIKDLKI